LSRRLARETALQVLFQLDMTKEEADILETVQHWAKEFAVPEHSIPFAQDLVLGTLKHRQDIDRYLTSLSDGWPLDRMGNVDRNLLRLASYEILFRSDIPGRVSLNEAIELAKRFGGDESAKFVNGLLDRLVTSSAKAEPKDPQAPTEATKPTEPTEPTEPQGSELE